MFSAMSADSGDDGGGDEVEVKDEGGCPEYEYSTSAGMAGPFKPYCRVLASIVSRTIASMPAPPERRAVL